MLRACRRSFDADATVDARVTETRRKNWGRRVLKIARLYSLCIDHSASDNPDRWPYLNCLQLTRSPGRLLVFDVAIASARRAGSAHATSAQTASATLFLSEHLHRFDLSCSRGWQQGRRDRY